MPRQSAAKMASPLSLIISALLSLLLGSYGGQVVHGDDHRVQVVSVDSLLPAAVCSTPRARGRNSLEVVHRHGPCSPTPTGSPTTTKPLPGTRGGLHPLQARLSTVPGGNVTLLQGSKVSVPASRGTSVGTSTYVVKLGFGTPMKNQTVIFDTGSDVCWLQCKPCSVSCYQQQEPIFDPSASSTYRNIPCTSAACGNLSSGACSGGNCVYRVRYGDNSSTVGFMAIEKLTVSPTDVFPSFMFGCGQNNQGSFGKAAGLVGLGRSPYSLLSQTASRLGNAFSYCLPRTSSTTGHLTLGKIAVPSAVYTPMLTDARDPSLYFIDLIGISVGTTQLPVQAMVFRSVGTIIDSGTVITRLPPAAYAALRSAFQSAMSQYPLAKPFSILDTCYDLSKAGTVSYPAITLHYNGVDLMLGSAGVFYIVDISQVCLAFAGNTDPNELGIVGNIQQRAFEVIYDVGLKKIGFAAGTCG